ncbi:MAG TPA: ATPase, T2SS/T4P/T4SS family, partial [Longimicrobiales bacterium]|nr:ATPase, T2SS/T4P/T4SS family [Longimicrobiales bacterium]
MATKKRLGERLLEQGIVTQQQLADAMRAQQVTGEELGSALLRLGFVQEDDLMRLLCEDAQIPYMSLVDHEPEAGAARSIPEALARVHGAVPLAEEGGRLKVALGNPFDIGAVTALERVTGHPLSVVAAPRAQIARVLDRLYGGVATEPASLPAVDVREPVRAATTDGGVTASRQADDIIQRAVRLGATDIHLEPEEDRVRVRYRVDGQLQDGPDFPKSLQSPLVTRIKILAGLNIAESRLPQDGRFRLDGASEVDLRISTFPTMYGEDVVLRVLDRTRVRLDLEGLGMSPTDLKLFRSALHKPFGLVPVTGPTGSGKTTTLYSGLKELNTTERSILTLEDPIEYELQGVRQSQINLRAGLTFASGLRSLLRHDPDVMLVGEMRDAETVQIALSAALTGHLVPTTPARTAPHPCPAGAGWRPPPSWCAASSAPGGPSAPRSARSAPSPRRASRPPASRPGRAGAASADPT